MAKVQKKSGSQTWKLLDMTETASGSNVQSTKSTCYRNISWKSKAWREATQRIEQKSLTDHKPKRSNGSTHIHGTSYSNNLSKTTTRHLASIKTLGYSIST